MFLPHRTPPLPALSNMDKEAETSRVWQSDRIRPKDPALALNSLTSLILWRFQEKWNCRRWSLLLPRTAEPTGNICFLESVLFSLRECSYYKIKN